MVLQAEDAWVKQQDTLSLHSIYAPLDASTLGQLAGDQNSFRFYSPGAANQGKVINANPREKANPRVKRSESGDYGFESRWRQISNIRMKLVL